MSKFSLVVRNLILSDETKNTLEEYVTSQGKLAPGQVRKREEWYLLTYLRVVKLKNFDLTLWEMLETEVDCIRATSFQFKKSKLLVNGSKSDVKEITQMLEALVLKVAGNKEDQTINYDDYYKLSKPEIDLDNVLKAYESKDKVADVRKLVLKDMEVKVGSVKRCVINTNDYGGVKKILEAQDNRAMAIEIALKDPEKTYVYVDTDGQVRVQCNGADDAADVEQLAIDCAMLL